MDERELKEIMSQGAIRPETPRHREERRIIAEELATSPVKGQPLRRRLRNFRPDVDATIRGLSGPPIWMRRLREIEEELDRHERELAEARRRLAAEDDVAERRRELAENWNLSVVNDLIERHNRNFPAEARLPMDPKTRDFVKVNGRPYRRAPLDAAWILERLRIDVDDSAE